MWPATISKQMFWTYSYTMENGDELNSQTSFATRGSALDVAMSGAAARGGVVVEIEIYIKLPY